MRYIFFLREKQYLYRYERVTLAEEEPVVDEL